MSKTKKILSRYDIKNMNIDLSNAPISDIITKGNGWFKNEMTGKVVHGKAFDTIFDVVRDDRNFIVMPEDTYGLYGYNISIDEENDIIFFIMYELTKEKDKVFWREADRSFYSRSDLSVGYCKNDNYYSAVDICGQTIVSSRYDYVSSVEPVHAKDTMFKYFGGPVVMKNLNDSEEHFVMTFDSFSSICSVFSLVCNGCIDDWGDEYMIMYNQIMEVHDRNISFVEVNKNQLPELPKEADCVIKQNLIKMLNDNIRAGNLNTEITKDNDFEFSCIQNVDGALVLRCYKPVFFGGRTDNDLGVGYFEYKRVFLDEMTVYSKKESAILPLWMDDVKGTIIEYSSHLIKKWFSVLENEKKEKNRYFVDTWEIAMGYYRRATSINPHYAVYMACSIGKNKISEMLLNLKCAGAEALNDYFCTNVANGMNSMEETITQLFGIINSDGKTLQQILMIPKGMLEYALSQDRIYIIKSIKHMFFRYNDGVKYLANMNKTDYEFLFDSIKNNRWLYANLISLMDIYGMRSWKSYLNHLIRLSEEDKVKYDRFITMLNALNQEAKEVEWKLSGDALVTTSISLEEAYLLQNDPELFENTKNKYEKLSEKWKQYSYSDDDYLVTYPKGPMDVLKEGVFLNHCAKEFIRCVGNDKTMLLFIREAKNPEKPYFTLEINDGCVRQCHGNSNSCVQMGTPLQKFLMKFCKEKDIVYSLGTDLCAAPEQND